MVSDQGICISQDFCADSYRLAGFLEQVRATSSETFPAEKEDSFSLIVDFSLRRTFVTIFNDVKILHFEGAFSVV